MMRLTGYVLPALIAAADGALDTISLRWRDDAAVVVVMVAEGYPGPYRKGTAIRGLGEAEGEDVTVLHAGTAADADGGTVAVGGRVLGVTALGRDIPPARHRSEEHTSALQSLMRLSYDTL